MGSFRVRSLLHRSAAALVLCIAVFLAGVLLPLQGLGVPQAMASETTPDTIPEVNCWVDLSNGVDPMADDSTSANTTIHDTVQLRNPALYSMPATGGPA